MEMTRDVDLIHSCSLGGYAKFVLDQFVLRQLIKLYSLSLSILVDIAYFAHCHCELVQGVGQCVAAN